MHRSLTLLLAAFAASSAPAWAELPGAIQGAGRPYLSLHPARAGQPARLVLDAGPPRGEAWLWAPADDVALDGQLLPRPTPPGPLLARLVLDEQGRAEVPLVGRVLRSRLVAWTRPRSGGLATLRVSNALASGSGRSGFAAAPQTGELIVTEFMKDPTFASDTDGEWIELWNRTSAAIDIEGWSVSDLGSNNHVIANGGLGVVVPPHGFFVLGRSDDFFMNGGVDVDYVLSSFTLSNSADEIILARPDGTVVEEVLYDSSWPNVPGRAVNLIRAYFDASANDPGTSWCSSWTLVNPAGPDQGTPGVRNDRCPNHSA